MSASPAPALDTRIIEIAGLRTRYLARGAPDAGDAPDDAAARGAPDAGDALDDAAARGAPDAGDASYAGDALDTADTPHTAAARSAAGSATPASRPPVLVLHGWGASIEAVLPIVTGLQAVARVYAVDLPGFGQSALPPRPWGVEDYQTFVAAFMDALGIERASLVGHSNGGRIAIRMAATAPQRVDKLVLVDSAGIRPRRTLRWYRRVAMAKTGKYAARLLGAPGERLRARLVGRAASADYLQAGAMRPTLVRLVNSDLRERLPQIQAPTLLIWGADDADTPLSAAREMERLIPDAGLVVFDGAGHYSYLDQPARFATVVSHFLAPPKASPTR